MHPVERSREHRIEQKSPAACEVQDYTHLISLSIGTRRGWDTPLAEAYIGGLIDVPGVACLSDFRTPGRDHDTKYLVLAC